MATGTMNNTQRIPFSIDPKDANGVSAPVEDLRVEVLNAGDLTSTINDDNKGGYIVSGSTLGSFQIKIHADAKIGDGVDALEETHDIVVTNPQATTLGGTFGTPEPKV